MSEAFKSTLDQILELFPFSLVIVNREGIMMRISHHTEKLFGYERNNLIGKPLDLLLPERFRQDHRNHLAKYFANPAIRPMGSGLELIGLHKERNEFPMEISLSPLETEKELMVMCVIQDITDRKKNAKMIYQLAYYDPLTGLPNRLLFHDLLEKTLQHGKREGKSVAVFILDLDRFKEINNTLGHDQGDLLLQQVGSRLKETIRLSDTVARVGGDEFGVLLLMTLPGHAGLVAQKIIQALEQPFDIAGLPIMVEAGIGIAIYPRDGLNADILIQKANVAMYVSKKERTLYALYQSEFDEHSPKRLALLGELRRGIEKRELFLHYQPKISLKTRKIVGVEALVRWKHPRMGMIPPDQFIFPAEQSGLIKPLTHFVLQEALDQCRVWHEKGERISMAVNLSMRSLIDPHLPEQILQLLQSSGINPVWLNLEITENTIMTNAENVIRTMLFMTQKGIKYSIDDFGIGYSSLSYLKKLPVKSIKIDRSFVMEMMVNEEDARIVHSTISLAHALNLEVIAEGVENQETLETLTSFGCDEAQGYFISRPVPADELEKMFSRKFL